jgi:hypothetical protein
MMLKKWRAQRHDFRTFLSDFVAALPQIGVHAGLSLYSVREPEDPSFHLGGIMTHPPNERAFAKMDATQWPSEMDIVAIFKLQ